MDCLGFHRNSHRNCLFRQFKQNQSACIGPKHGPLQAKMAENACMGPENGPVRALREIIWPGIALTLNRSTFGAKRWRHQAHGRPGYLTTKEANTEPTHERVKKVLASSSEREGGKTKFKGKQAAGVYEGAGPPVLRYGVVNLYLTI